MLTRRRLVTVTSIASLMAGAFAVAACGARTGLFVFTDEGAGTADAATDATRVGDGISQGTDALPPIDVAAPRVLSECRDAGSTLVYVISDRGTLMSFDPSTATFATIGRITCPGESGTPFSMAVDRTGVAYVVFDGDGQLFRVSTANASCRTTGFAPGQQGFTPTFGMGYVKNDVGTGETLYVADDSVDAGSRLASIDTTTFVLHPIGEIRPAIDEPELTGTGAGSLFALYAVDGAGTIAVGQIDKTTAQRIAQSVLVGVVEGNAWAFAFWGGDFYAFTQTPGDSASSIVTRFRPSDGSIARIAQSPERITGAGVSTCAPQQ